MTLDVGQAYLHADLTGEEVYIKIDEETIELLVFFIILNKLIRLSIG